MGSVGVGRPAKVLLTGGTGFIASHVLEFLIHDGFQVVVTVRSKEKGMRLLDSLDDPSRAATSFTVVGDISAEGAFDSAVKSDPPFDYVVHTASPYHLSVKDPVKDFLDPAIKGTTGILKSIKAYAPTVKRVVITSSSAAILQLGNHPVVYDESVWANMTWEDGMDPQKTYKTSKVLAEKAAWAFVENEKPNFDLAVINNTYTFGPLQKQLPSLDAMNTSNHRIRDMVLGKMKEGLEPTAPVFTYVDVRDVALAHVRCLTVPEAGGKRFYIVGAHFSNKQVADIIRKGFPELAKVLPAESIDDMPPDVYQFDNGRSRKVLGLDYIGLEQSVLDTTKSILDFLEVAA